FGTMKKIFQICLKPIACFLPKNRFVAKLIWIIMIDIAAKLFKICYFTILPHNQGYSVELFFFPRVHGIGEIPFNNSLVFLMEKLHYIPCFDFTAGIPFFKPMLYTRDRKSVV